MQHDDYTPEFLASMAEHYAAGRWEDYLFMCNNKDRAAELLRIVRHTRTPSRLWRLVAECWEMSNNISADKHVWEDIWNYAYRRSGLRLRRCHGLMSASQRQVFDNLPELVTVYRGCRHVDAADGYSWTLDRSVAEFFAHRTGKFHGRPMIATATIPREWILAYFDGRQEQEIVVNRLVFDYLQIDTELTELARPEHLPDLFNGAFSHFRTAIACE